MNADGIFTADVSSKLEEEILGKLVVDEQDMIRDLEVLVERATSHIKIEKPSGKIIFQNYSSLSDGKRISLFLMGKYFAARLKIIDSPSVSISQIAKEISRPMTTLSGPAAELVKKGFIEKKEDKTYIISHHRITEILNWIEKS